MIPLILFLVISDADADSLLDDDEECDEGIGSDRQEGDDDATLTKKSEYTKDRKTNADEELASDWHEDEGDEDKGDEEKNRSIE